MTEWIFEKAKDERRRRAVVAKFKAAEGQFAIALTESLSTAIGEFNRELPGEHEQTIAFARGDGGQMDIYVSKKTETIPRSTALAKISMISESQQLTCTFTDINITNFALALQEDNGMLRDISSDQSYTIAEITKRVLMPILFPALK